MFVEASLHGNREVPRVDLRNDPPQVRIGKMKEVVADDARAREDSPEQSCRSSLGNPPNTAERSAAEPVEPRTGTERGTSGPAKHAPVAGPGKRVTRRLERVRSLCKAREEGSFSTSAPTPMLTRPKAEVRRFYADEA